MANNSNKNDNSIKIGLGVWVCFCILIFLWVFTRFLRGKQQIFSNLHVVEESLRLMQEQLELELRRKSMGYVETLDDVTACLNENIQESKGDAESEAGHLLSTENEMSKLNEEVADSVEEPLEDKKHI